MVPLLPSIFLETQQPHSDYTCVLRNGSPYLVANILGLIGSGSQQLEFLVDTGFTGFVAVPDYVAQGLGMPFWSFQTTRLADGSVRTSVDCVGRMTIDGETKELFVSILPDSQSAAVGMSFLRLFELDLLLFQGKYFNLISLKEQEERRERQQESAAKVKEKVAPIDKRPTIEETVTT